MNDLSGHVLIVEQVIQRGALGHKDHEQGDVIPGVGEQQGGGHSPHCRPAHVQAGADGLPPAEVGALFHHLMDGGGNIHAQVHYGPRGPQKDGGHIDLRQVQVLISGIEQAFGVAHHRPMDLEQVGKHHP